MTEHQVSRTLVKSPPELWSECRDPASLTRHLDRFGEISITEVDPERAVWWEGDAASGSVRLEPSGWGTRVTITASAAPEATAPPPPAPPRPRVRTVRRGALGRLLSLLGRRLAGRPAAPTPQPAPQPALPEHSVSGETEAVLTAALDSLGRAHHRPFSRA